MKRLAETFFYQVGRQNREATLRSVLVRSRRQGWRVAVRFQSKSQASEVDDALWRVPQNGFLPHGLAGGQFDEDQPILLTTERNSANRPDALVMYRTFDLDPGEIGEFRRVSIMFDGSEQEELSAARRLWKTLKAAEAPIKYWEHSGEGWNLKASENLPEVP